MNLIELQRALRQLRLGGIAEVLETRLHQAQTESMAPIDLVSCLVSDELERRSVRLLERRRKQARFRDPQTTLDNFDFTFNKKMNRSLVFDLATAAFISRHEDALFLGPPGTGKSHLAQAIGLAAIQQGYRVIYRETHALLEDIADATIDGARKKCMENLATVPLLIIDDLGMRKLPPTAAEELLEIVMRRYERTSTLLRFWCRQDCQSDKIRSAARRCGLCGHDVTPDHRGIRLPWDRNCELAFVDLLGQFDTDNHASRIVERLESQHRAQAPLHPAVVLLHNVVQILAATNRHRIRAPKVELPVHSHAP